MIPTNIIVRVLFSLVFFMAIGLFFFSHKLSFPIHLDENFYYQTIKEFYNYPDLYTLKHYREFNPPLPYIVYALWAKISGLSLPRLRLFSLIIYLLSSLVWLKILIMQRLRNILLVIGFLLFAFNPYIVSNAMVIYNDLFSVLLVLLFIYSVLINSSLGLLMTGVALAYSRQYNEVIIFSYWLVLIYNCFKKKKLLQSRDIYLLSFVGLSILPLFLFWGGISPVSTIVSAIAPDTPIYQPVSILVYLYCFSVYALPLVLIIVINSIRTQGKAVVYNWLCCLILSLICLVVVPIAPSASSMKDGSDNVGYSHRFLLYVFNHSEVVNYFFLIPLSMTLLIIYAGFKRIKDLDTCNKWYLFSFIVFLIIMPFSFQIWEKYFMIELPLVLLFLLNQIKLN